MSEFYTGQKLTAGDLNKLAEQANEGMTSTNQIVNGKLLNSPTQLQYKQMYQSPRFLDAKYLMANCHFEGEEEGINQHMYLCLIDSEQQAFRTDGSYYTFEKDKTRFVVMFIGDGDNIPIRIVTKQDLDVNTDIETRDMGNILSGYAPQTNYNGFVETPIPPGYEVSIAQIGIFNSAAVKVGAIFLIYAVKKGGWEISEAAQERLKDQLRESGFWGDDIDKLYSERGFNLSIIEPEISSSYLLNQYQAIAGAYQFEIARTDPWTVDAHNGTIINPIYQLGTEVYTCGAYEDENYGLSVLSATEENPNPKLSARMGTNYCVVDVPRLSAFHTWDSEDHPLSDSPNINRAFNVKIPVFRYRYEGQLSSIPWITISYLQRYPVIPCWQIYPY